MTALVHGAADIEPRIFEVYLCGVHVRTITAPTESEAHLKACHGLELDSDDAAVQVFEVFE